MNRQTWMRLSRSIQKSETDRRIIPKKPVSCPWVYTSTSIHKKTAQIATSIIEITAVVNVQKCREANLHLNIKARMSSIAADIVKGK